MPSYLNKNSIIFRRKIHSKSRIRIKKELKYMSTIFICDKVLKKKVNFNIKSF